jgi:flagellar export protein FliJ
VEHAQQNVAREEKKRLEILHQIDTALQVAFNDYNRMLEEGVLDLTASQRFSHYVARMKQQRRQHEARLCEQEKVLLKAREALKVMMVRKKSLEILKEKACKRFRQGIEKEEEKFLSELALNRRTLKRLYR